MHFFMGNNLDLPLWQEEFDELKSFAEFLAPDVAVSISRGFIPDKDWKGGTAAS